MSANLFPSKKLSPQQVGLLSAAIPSPFGDALGLLADTAGYVQDPSSLTPGRGLLSLAALIPGIPRVGTRAKLAKSAVRDAAGELKPVYHGTTADIPWFGQKVGKRSTSDPNSLLGTHFASQPAVASDFAQGNYKDLGGGGRVFQAYLNVKNPMRFHSETDLNAAMARFAHEHGLLSTDALRAIKSRDAIETAARIDAGEHLAKISPEDVKRGFDPLWYSTGTDVMKHAKNRKDIARRFKKHLEAQGVDGIEYGNNLEGIAERSWIAFNPDQIITATGNPRK